MTASHSAASVLNATSAPGGGSPGHGSLGNRLRLAAADIKLAHSVFAMPFALLGAVLALPQGPTHWGTIAAQIGLVAVCMFLARTWAMLVNRLADARFDRANPRTARRMIASGALSVRDAGLFTGACAGLFILAAGAFWPLFGNPWPLVLAAPVLAWLALYSFAKRFTAACHVLLGTALAISPLAAALAIRPSALIDVPALYWLAGMVAAWVAGFDIIYALQDVGFDRGAGLHSVPARIGVRAAIMLSRLLHAGAWACLLLAWRSDGHFGPIFLGAIGLVAALLVFEHVHLARRGQAGLEMAFFTVNGIVSCIVGAAGIADAMIG